MSEPRVVFAEHQYEMLSDGTINVLLEGKKVATYSVGHSPFIAAYIAQNEAAITEREERIAAQAKEIEQLRRLTKPFMDAFDEEEGKL